MTFDTVQHPEGPELLAMGLQKSPAKAVYGPNIHPRRILRSVFPERGGNSAPQRVCCLVGKRKGHDRCGISPRLVFQYFRDPAADSLCFSGSGAGDDL